MAEYITRIKTENGPMQIDYNALANLPKSDSTLSQSGKFADAKMTGDKIKDINEKLNGVDVGIQGINTDIEGINTDIKNLNEELKIMEQHTHNVATSSTAGLMSAEDKEKLDNISEYELPTADFSTLGGVTTTSDVTSTDGLTACPIIEGVPYYEYSTLESLGVTATVEEINKLSGLPTVAEKTKTTQLVLTQGDWYFDGDLSLWLYDDDNVLGVDDDSIVFVSPAPNSMKAWAKHSVRCTSQAFEALYFEADTDPNSSDDIYVNVAILA